MAQFSWVCAMGGPGWFVFKKRCDFWTFYRANMHNELNLWIREDQSEREGQMRRAMFLLQEQVR